MLETQLLLPSPLLLASLLLPVFPTFLESLLLLNEPVPAAASISNVSGAPAITKVLVTKNFPLLYR